MADWDTELSAFLQPFVDKLGHKKRRQMCPLYVSGLIGPGDRKSIEPMTERFAPSQYDRLHHFISDGLWNAAPLETELARQADRIVGAIDAFLVIDDTAFPRKATTPSVSRRNTLRPIGYLPPGAEWTWPHLGSRHPQTSEGLSP